MSQEQIQPAVHVESVAGIHLDTEGMAIPAGFACKIAELVCRNTGCQRCIAQGEVHVHLAAHVFHKAQGAVHHLHSGFAMATRRDVLRTDTKLDSL